MKLTQTQTTDGTLLQAALDLHRQGCSLIPVKSDKKPLIGWRKYQEQPASTEEIENWAKKFKPFGFAIVTGSVSGRVVLDVDSDQGFEALFTRGFQLPPTLTVRTPRGGSHFHFEDPGLSTKNFVGGTPSCPLIKVDFRDPGRRRQR